MEQVFCLFERLNYNYFVKKFALPGENVTKLLNQIRSFNSGFLQYAVAGFVRILDCSLQYFEKMSRVVLKEFRLVQF